MISYGLKYFSWTKFVINEALPVNFTYTSNYSLLKKWGETVKHIV